MCDCLTCDHKRRTHEAQVLASLEVSFLGAQYAVERAQTMVYCAANYSFMREQYLAKEAA